ncbi:MAG: hypothetical protein ACI9U2_000628 [Bradymonadia bacterium]|jgi:hypothetical protein
MRRTFFICLAGCALMACGPTVQKRPSFEHKPPPDAESPPPQRRDDGMAVEGLLGSLDDDQVFDVINQQMAGFNNCFGRSEGSFVSGEVQLSFVVAPTGRVSSVHVSESDLGSWKVEDCLVQTGSFLEFPQPQGGGPAKFIFPFTWNERARRLAQPVNEAWGYATLRKHRDLIRGCRTTHGFDGPFHLTMYVGPRGNVLATGFHAKSAPSKNFPVCVVQTLAPVRFPDPGARTVKYRALVEDLPDADAGG